MKPNRILPLIGALSLLIVGLVAVWNMMTPRASRVGPDWFRGLPVLLGPTLLASGVVHAILCLPGRKRDKSVRQPGAAPPHSWVLKLGLILLLVGGFPWLYTPLIFGSDNEETWGMLGTMIFILRGHARRGGHGHRMEPHAEGSSIPIAAVVTGCTSASDFLTGETASFGSAGKGATGAGSEVLGQSFVLAEKEFGNLSGLHKFNEIVTITGRRHSKFNQGGAQRWEIIRNGSLTTPTFLTPSGRSSNHSSLDARVVGGPGR